MKIEKLTENKIRIFLKKEDIKDQDIDLQTLMTKAAQSQGFFLDILNKAEEQFGFNTDGCRLLIEASSPDGNDFVFTITKYLNETQPPIRKKAIPKKIKSSEFVDKYENQDPFAYKRVLFYFEDFEAFCKLCVYLSNSNMKVAGLASSISLHHFNNTYYLLLKDIRNNSSYKNLFYTLTEFGKYTDFSPNFESKILEHGKIIIQHNALNRGIKYFA